MESFIIRSTRQTIPTVSETLNFSRLFKLFYRTLAYTTSNTNRGYRRCLSLFHLERVVDVCCVPFVPSRAYMLSKIEA